MSHKTTIKCVDQSLCILMLLKRCAGVSGSCRHLRLSVVGAKVLLLGFCLLIAPALKAQSTHTIDSSKFTIVTWNIQMLPNGFALFSKALRKKQGVRAPWIAAYCMDNNYDIIVFQEVFDINIKNKLIKALGNAYPYQVHPRKRPGSLVSNGILIVSRVPIRYLDHIIFNRGVHADRWASKGCTLVELEKDGLKMQIAGTHLQSGEAEADEYHRDLQYQAIRDLLDRNKSDSIPVFVLGDMNTRKSNLTKYPKMLDIIGIRDFILNDSMPFTIDSNNYWKGSVESVQLDYILLQPRRTSTHIINQTILRPKHAYKGFQMDLSDHYGIVAEIQVVND